MKFKPLNDWVVIRPSDAAERSAGGIYIPDSAKDKPSEGTVEDVGPGALEEKKYDKKHDKKKERRFIPTSVKPGEYVLYEQYSGQSLKIGDEDRILVKERDILGILINGPSLSMREGKTLQIPAITSGSGPTALQKSVIGVSTGKSAVKKAKKKTRKKAAKKAVKKTTKKPSSQKKVKTKKKSAPVKKSAQQKTKKKKPAAKKSRKK